MVLKWTEAPEGGLRVIDLGLFSSSPWPRGAWFFEICVQIHWKSVQEFKNHACLCCDLGPQSKLGSSRKISAILTENISVKFLKLTLNFLGAQASNSQRENRLIFLLEPGYGANLKTWGTFCVQGAGVAPSLYLSQVAYLRLGHRVLRRPKVA